MNWFTLSLFAGLSIGGATVFYKLLGNYYNSLGINIRLFSLVVIYLLLINLRNIKNIFKCDKALFLSGIFFGLFNLFFIRAVLSYHNPGVISSLLRFQIPLTYIIFLILGSAFRVKEFLLVILIIIGALLNMIDFKKMKIKESENNQISNNKKEWIFYILIAIISFSLFDLFIKRSSADINLSLKSFVYSFIALLTLIIISLSINSSKIFKIKKNSDSEEIIHSSFLTEETSVKFDKNIHHKLLINEGRKNIRTKNDKKLRYVYLIICSILIFLYLYFLTEAVGISPRPSSVKAVTSIAMIVALILSFLVFGAIPDRYQIIGSIIIMFAVILYGFI